MTAIEDARARLQRDYEAQARVTLRELFDGDADRFATFSAGQDDLLLDYSKCRVTTGTVALLEALVNSADVAARRDGMFSGERINVTEDRAVLHVALRNIGDQAIVTDGADVMPDVKAVLARMEEFSRQVRGGAHVSATGKAFTDVVNLGIGGSDLGPVMATTALAPYHDGPRVHYVSNIDSAHLADTLHKLSPDTTLFVIASKSFSTLETMTNAHSARKWIVDGLGEAAVGAHFCALSTALDKVAAFGIAEECTFGFWDWVGGRYSVWSAIGLPVMLAVGPGNFRSFLAGGHQMDENFKTAPFRQNLAMLLGAIGYWHRAICGFPARAVLPYEQRLARFPAHLQQLDMESNGKSVTLSGGLPAGPTGPVVFGEPGTNGQHAFFQLLHQGTDIVPCEFLIAGEGHEPSLAHHHRMLVANCLAQSEAMAFGRTRDEVEAELNSQGLSPERIAKLAPHKVFPGNRPSVTLAYRKLDPAMLGKLLALYEHRVFVESVLYDINAFDQWGVELGKTLAGHVDKALEDPEQAKSMNSSTRGLMSYLGRR